MIIMDHRKPKKSIKKQKHREESKEPPPDVADLTYEDPLEDELDSENDAIYHSGSSVAEIEAGEDFQNLQLSETPSGLSLVHNPNYNPCESSSDSEPKEAWTGDPHSLKKGEFLDFENSAYTMFYRTSVEWSCLSVDWVLPAELCTDFPYTVYIASGSQAPAKENKLYFMKWSQLYSTKNDDKSESSLEGVSSDEESAEGEEPQLEYIEIPHKGVVNRVRVHNAHNLLGTWSDSGTVYIYDATRAISKLESLKGIINLKAKISSEFHIGREGYGLCWGPEDLYAGGDSLYRFAHSGGSWTHVATYTGHTDSVEDIQQSPVEPFVIATCSADRTIKLWDLRSAVTDSQLTIPNAHSSDVNVIAWNKLETSQICSGGDDGGFKVWDLRMTESEVAGIAWHSDAITSICWNPGDATELAVGSADDRITVWDLSVESEGEVHPGMPSQLLFTHQGQEDIKELAYHPSYFFVLSTAANSFNLFKPNIYVSEE